MTTTRSTEETQMDTRPYDPAEVARIALAERTGPDGRHDYLFRPGGYIQPNNVGEWLLVEPATIRQHLTATCKRLGWTAHEPRIAAATAAFAALHARATNDQLPTVDAVAVCTPDEVGKPPRIWPSTALHGDPRRSAQAWARNAAYGQGGRYLVQVYGQVREWSAVERTWKKHPGLTSWLRDSFIETFGRTPDVSTLEEIRDLIGVPSSGFSTPGDVAAYDLRRAIADVRRAQKAHYDHRTRPISMGSVTLITK